MGIRTASTVFVGRRDELARLADALDRARANQGSMVLISADAGVGKSRITTEFADRARDAGAAVVSGGCLRIAGSHVPFAPMTEALRSLADEQGLEALRRVAGDSLRVLAALVPSLSPAPGRHGGAAEHGPEAQFRMFDALLRLLTQVGGQEPAVLVLEDVHWADPSTLDLLLFLAHHVRETSLLVVATHRRAELVHGHPLRSVLAELHRNDRVHSIELEPFDRQEMAVQLEAILAAPPRRELVERVYERSQGNAFFVEELVASGATDRAAPLPASLREMLLAGLDTLPAVTLQVLRAAAAAGRRVHHELLALVVAPMADAALDDALRYAVDRRVLLPDAQTSTYEFRHALFAEAIASTLLPGEHRRLHRRLAEALEEQPNLAGESPAGRVATHWHAAGEPEHALTASVRAAEEAEAMHAVVEARQHLERALSAWSQVQDASALAGLSHAELLAWSGRLSHLAGDSAAAIDRLNRALAADAGADPMTRGSWHLLLGTCRHNVGDAAGGQRDMDRALELVRHQPPSAVRVRVLSAHAAHLWEQDPARGAEFGREAVEIARALDDRSVEAIALRALGSCLGSLGHLDEAVARLLDARELHEDSDPIEIARSHMQLSATLIRGGRASDGADDALAGLERSRELGIERLYGPILAANATSGLFWSGRWEEATRIGAAPTGHGPEDGFLALLCARVRAHLGDIDGALAVLDGDSGRAARTDPRCPSVLLAVASLAGDLDEAHRIVLDRSSFPPPLHAATRNELVAWSLRVEADRGAPERELCDQLVAELTMERSAGAAHAGPWRLTALAEHARAVGSADAEAWQSAHDAWLSLGWPYPVAYSGYRLAEATASGGAGKRAGELLRDAYETAESLGAAHLQHDVRTLARRLDVDLGITRERRSSEGAAYGLTPREREVLALVARGYSNPAIGEALYISAKTASVHVSNILRKLEVGGRTEAAALAVREGLDASE